MAQRPGAPTALFRFYRAASTALAPLAFALASRKLRRHGVTAARRRERLGHATLSRPSGRLIWFHAASVGESLSVLTLIARMGARLADTEFLITSGTATSARLINERLPPRCRHQFAPLDAPRIVARFLDHWRPDAGIFVESELWPVMLAEAGARGIPLALLNARLSPRSAARWQRHPETARFVLGHFALILTQNRDSAMRLAAMQAPPERLREGSNLKALSAPLPVDHAALDALRAALGPRPHWLASSTHEGEERIVLAAARDLLRSHPDLCLLLMPRHPERGDTVEAQIRAAGFTCARRSRGELPGEAQVYLADTLGETGTFYALCPRVFLGGSLLPIGGHNPFEPAQAGAAIVSGPHVANFAETYGALADCGAARLVRDGDELAQVIGTWLDRPQDLSAAREAAGRFAAARAEELDAVAERLCSALGLDTPRAAP